MGGNFGTPKVGSWTHGQEKRTNGKVASSGKGGKEFRAKGLGFSAEVKPKLGLVLPRPAKSFRGVKERKGNILKITGV